MQELAKRIIELVGGKENITGLTHCVTRLRFNLADGKKADTKALEEMEGVLGVQEKGGQYQVIIGGKVAKVYRDITKELPNLGSGEASAEKKKESLGNRIINGLSAMLVPSLAPIVGGGMLKGFLYMLTTFGLADPESGTMFVMNITADAMFYFFPFLLAVSSARFFKTNEYMAVTLAGVMMYPSLLNAATAGEIASVNFLGFLPIPVVNYSSSVLPIILSVWLLSHVYRFFEDHMPSMITIIFTPLLTLLVVVPVMLFGIAPLGFYIGEYVARGMEALINWSPLLSGFVAGATRPLLVLTGMHHAVRPISQQQIATFGYSTFSAMSFMSTMAQATAALAIALIVRDKRMKQVATSSAVSGYIGITEPALYGVLVKYKAAFLGASLGGGIGGAIGTQLGAKAMAPVMPSVLSIPVYLNDTAVGFLIGLATTIVSTFVITILLSKSVMKLDDGTEKKKADDSLEAQSPVKVYSIASPAAGTAYPISEVADATFSKGLMGNGLAILPSGNEILSPVDGVVKVAYKTRHAIGLVSEDGVEVLLHIGIDTVELNGEGFESLCEEGRKVSVGTPLIRFDREKLDALEYDTSVIMVITNTDDYLSVLCEDQQKSVSAGDKVVQIVPETAYEPAKMPIVS